MINSVINIPFPWILFFGYGQFEPQLPATNLSRLVPGSSLQPVTGFPSESFRNPMEAEPLIESSFRRLLASLDARPKCFFVWVDVSFGSMENWWVYSIYSGWLMLIVWKRSFSQTVFFFCKKAVHDWWKNSRHIVWTDPETNTMGSRVERWNLPKTTSIRMFNTCHHPICSTTYGIFTYIYHTFEPKVGKHSIHGAFGHDKLHPRFLPNTAFWIVLGTENHFRGPSWCKLDRAPCRYVVSHTKYPFVFLQLFLGMWKWDHFHPFVSFILFLIGHAPIWTSQGRVSFVYFSGHVDQRTAFPAASQQGCWARTTPWCLATAFRGEFSDGRWICLFPPKSNEWIPKMIGF